MANRLGKSCFGRVFYLFSLPAYTVFFEQVNNKYRFNKAPGTLVAGRQKQAAMANAGAIAERAFPCKVFCFARAAG